MPASRLNPHSAAPTRIGPQRAKHKKPTLGFTRPKDAQSFLAPLFSNVTRLKREGVGDLQFNLLSVGAGFLSPAPHKMRSTKERAGTSGTIFMSGD